MDFGATTSLSTNQKLYTSSLSHGSTLNMRYTVTIPWAGLLGAVTTKDELATARLRLAQPTSAFSITATLIRPLLLLAFLLLSLV
jgi:hypothetical protein